MYHGLTQHKMGNVDWALKDFNQVIEHDSKFTEAYFHRGNLYLDQGDYDCAIADYDKALCLKLNNTETYETFINLGNIYIIKGEYDLAIEYFNEALRLKGNYDRVIADHKKILKDKPDDTIAYTIRGIAYHMKVWLDLAIADYDQAIHLKSNDAAAFYNRGIAYAKKGHYDKARQDFHEALRLKPNNQKARKAPDLLPLLDE